MQERNAAITFKGNPMTLVGPEIKAGAALPDFSVIGQDMKPIVKNDFVGKVLVVSVVPSLDTPVCATQTRKFNEKAAGLSGNVAILTVSMDLPMAAKRFCGAEGIEQVKTGSDFKDHSFGTTFGVRIKELGLLARAVFVADKSGKVVHAEYVGEVVNEPNYDAALAAVQKAG